MALRTFTVAGMPIQLEEWATQATMEAIEAGLERTNNITGLMLGEVKDLEKVSDNVIDALRENADATKINAESIAQVGANQEGAIIGATRTVTEAAGFFGDSEKPLTGMVGAAKKLTGGLAGNSQAQRAVADKFPSLFKFMSDHSNGLSVLGDAALAYAGWNAAKFEQFAEVQGKMINAGAIFYENASVFDQLYDESVDAGISYTEFSNVVNSFGGTMSALGGDVSSGSRNFLKFFSALQDQTNSMGDLGMTNKEMSGAFAQFLEVQRLTGRIDTGIANQGQGLRDSFADLVVETTALANLSSLNRNEALTAQLSALSDTYAAAGLQALEKDGLTEQHDAASALIKQIALVSDKGPGAPLMQELASAFNEKLNEFKHNIGAFDVRLGLGEDARGAFNTAMPGFLERINQIVRTGDMTAEEAQKFVIAELAKAGDNALLATGSGSMPGQTQSAINAITASGVLVQKHFKAFLATSDVTLLKSETKKRLDESGSAVEQMNALSEAFLKAQNFITLPMGTLSSSVESLSKFFEDVASGAADAKNTLFGTSADDTTANEITETIQTVGNMTPTTDESLRQLSTSERQAGRGLSNDMLGARLSREAFFNANNRGSNFESAVTPAQVITPIQRLEKEIEELQKDIDNVGLMEWAFPVLIRDKKNLLKLREKELEQEQLRQLNEQRNQRLNEQ